jgi:hypothetical protein
LRYRMLDGLWRWERRCTVYVMQFTGYKIR